MSKRKKNLRTQLNWAINSNFEEGVDKHSYKHDNGLGAADIVFSHKSKFNLKDFTVNFSNYVKQNHPEIRDVSQITPEAVQGFLNEKAKTCTQKTVNTYATNFRKMEKLINKTYDKAELDYSKQIVVPSASASRSASRGAQAKIPRENLDKVLDTARQSECQSAYAVQLQEKLCVRVDEIVNIQKNNIDMEHGTMTLICKGKKELEREMDDETKNLVQKIWDHNFSENKLFSVRDDSVNKYLRETEDKLGLDRNSFHDIRRTLAQEYYDKLREAGLSISDAADQTSMYLNHNKNRTEMLKECYIHLT